MKIPAKVRWKLFTSIRSIRWWIDENLVGGPEYEAPSGLFRFQLWLLKQK